MDTGKAIVLASILLCLVVGITSHLFRQDTACANLFNAIGDSSMVSFITLYDQGRLKADYAEPIRYAEKMHGITVNQCMNR